MSFADVAVAIPLFPNKRFFEYEVPPELMETLRPGHMVSIPFGNRKTWGVVWGFKDRPLSDPKKIKKIEDLRFDKEVFSDEQRLFAEWLCDRYFYPMGEVCEAMLPAAVRKASKKLLGKFYQSSENEEVLFSVRELNADQQNAVREIEEAKHREHLLWGVTGSGKTEVYLHLIDKKLRAGQGSIVLVPEIGLTPQLFSRFETSFPGQVAVFHSAQTEKEQRNSWLDIFFENKKIALGPRSALFAPVKNLGLIVMDEEHETSYKQEDRLRYHARVAAGKLAEIRGAQLLLGSATPSAETLYKGITKQIGLSKLELRAVEKSRRPEIQIVDLKKKLSQKNFDPALQEGQDPFALGPESLFFSDELIKELEQVFAKKEQAILFLNRRGLGRARLCKGCGDQPTCIQCAVNLIPHKSKMLCHYCGFEAPIPNTCGKCGGEMKEIGFGTQALEETLQRFFPKIRSLRLDRDVVQDRKKLVDTLRLFTDKKADVLLGTQMVAKGHDFPEVSFVGVILADVGFSLPDFRNEEKFFQLLTQVSGRAGRAQIPGRVVIQTFRPEENIFAQLKTGEDLKSYETFISNILESRKFLNYPPFARLAMLQFQGLDQNEVENAATLVSQALERVKAKNFWVLGSVPSPVVKVRNKFRYQILLKAESDEVLKKSLTWVQEKWVASGLEKKFQNTRMIIDVDPVGML